MSRVLFKTAFQSLEQGKGVGGCASETSDDGTIAQRPDFAGIRLDDGIAKADLTVAGDDDRSFLRTDKIVVPRQPGFC